MAEEKSKLLDENTNLVDKLHHLESNFESVVAANAAASDLLQKAIEKGANLEATVEELQKELLVSLDRRADDRNKLNFGKKNEKNYDNLFIELSSLTYSQLIKLKDDNCFEKKCRDPNLLHCLVCLSEFTHNLALNKHIDCHFQTLIQYKRKYKEDFYKAISIV